MEDLSDDEITVLRREVVAAREDAAAARETVARLHRQLAQQAENWRVLCVASPLTDLQFTENEPEQQRRDWLRWWKSWCPCCKRPLDITCHMAAAVSDCRNRKNECSLTTTQANVHDAERDSQCRYAYVSTLWGSNPGFSLGALVLGQSLRRSGTRHDLVLLHTIEVPSQHLQLLSQIWMLKCVDAIDANDMLFSSGREGSRFSGVFTKLHGLDLVEYS